MGLRLDGARVLLTGATGGVGQAIARRLAREGAQLVVTARRAPALQTIAEELGARALVVDLARRDEVARLLATVGEIDVLVANAALPGSGRLGTLERDHLDRAIEVNLRAPIVLAHGLSPAMVQRGRGHLVFIGSLGGKAASGGSSVYSATKFGLRGFALALRSELRPSGIGVSLVAPGFISGAGMFADTKITLPRYLTTRTPQQVADAVVSAIAENRGEVNVAALGMRLGANLANLTPALAARASRMLRADRLALQFEERQADKR